MTTADRMAEIRQRLDDEQCQDDGTGTWCALHDAWWPPEKPDRPRPAGCKSAPLDLLDDTEWLLDRLDYAHEQLDHARLVVDQHLARARTVDAERDRLQARLDAARDTIERLDQQHDEAIDSVHEMQARLDAVWQVIKPGPDECGGCPPEGWTSEAWNARLDALVEVRRTYTDEGPR